MSSGRRLAPLFTALTVLLAAAPAAAWEPLMNVSNSCCGAYYPTLRHDDAGRLHLWWVQVEAGGDKRWLLTYARDDGGGFSPGQTIGGTLDARAIEVVGTGDLLQLVFSAFRGAYGDGCKPGALGGCSDLYFMESSDAGATWSTPTPLPHPEDAAQRYDPALARGPDGRLVVAHERDDTIYTYTRPDGGDWGPETAVVELHAGAQHSARVAFSVAGDLVYTHLWMRAKPKDEPGDVLLYTRHDGVAWSPAVSISPIIGGAILSSVTGDGAGLLQVAFQSSGSGEYAIYYIESPDHGTTWTAPVQLSAPGYAARPAVARELYGPTLHVVWDRTTAIGYSGGAGVFSPEAPLSGSLEKSLEAHVSAGSDAVAVAFHARATPDLPYDIYVTRQPPVDPAPVDPTGGSTGPEPTTSGTDGDGTTSDGTTASDETTGGPEPTSGGSVVPGGASGPVGSDTSDAPGASGEGCGCAATDPSTPLGLLLLGLAARRRSRRGRELH